MLLHSKNVSLGYCAQIAGISKKEFIEYLSDNGISIFQFDDKAAKKTAKYLGLSVTGTLGVILKAKREGYIDLVKPLIDDLSSAGFFVNEQVIQYVLEEAGEKQ